MARWGFLALAVLHLGLLRAPGQVQINEFLADNKGAVLNGATMPDFVELYNTNPAAVNLGGWTLTDDTNAPAKFVFSSGTLIPGRGYLLVYCDAVTNEPGIHTGFSFKASGEEIGLYQGPTNALVLVDYVKFGLQVADLSVSRLPEGTGAFVLSAPTPHATNRIVALGLATALRINEWLATNSTGADKDMLELYNTTNLPVMLTHLIVSGKPTTPSTSRPMPALSFIEARGFAKFICDSLFTGKGADHLDFRLSSSTGETNTLFATNGITILDRVIYGPQSPDVSMGRLPDGGTNIVFFPTTNFMSLGGPNQYQAVTNLNVNELLTHTDPPFEDAIELYNPTANDLNIGHWWISEDADRPQKFRVPANTIIVTGGFKVFYEQAGTTNPNGFNRSGTGNSPDFTLNAAHGGTLYISEGTAGGGLTGFQLTKSFGAAANGISFGRYAKSDGGTDLPPMSSRTFGADAPANVTQFRAGTGLPSAYPAVGPLIVSEILYRPPDFVVGTNFLDNSLDEFIELQNITGAGLPLYDPAYPTNRWQLVGAVTFVFPSNTVVAPNGFLLVVNFDPATNATQLAAFRTLYGVDAGVPIVGPYGGKLNNKSDVIEINKPDPVQLPPRPDAGFVPQVLVEKVKYEDTFPWPDNTDGTGFSLQRVSATGYANNQTNWFGGRPTAGRANVVVPPPFFLAPPANQYITVGGLALISATVIGAEPIGYQWLHNSSSLYGQTDSLLVVFNAQTNQAGAYRLIATNEGGSVTSAPAILSVAGTPTLSGPLVVANGQFQLSMDAIPGHAYRFEASTNLINWVVMGTFTSGGPLSITDTNAGRFPSRFYRAVLQP